MNNIFDTDGYKLSQWKQYPKGSEWAMSYCEARGDTTFEKRDAVKFFGLQYYLQHLTVPTVEQVEETRQLVEAYTGRTDIFNYDGWMQVAQMGYYPLKIRAVKEGTVVPTKQVLFTVENTLPGFVWLLSWFETQLLRVWYPTSVATISYNIQQMIAGYLEKNGTPETLNFKLHDFGARGVSCHEQAGIGGAAHLLNFIGSDTLIGALTAQKYYDADINGLAAGIPASEHSTITSWGADFEIDAFRNMIEQFGGEGMIYACVSDSYDVWAALDKWKELEPLILEKGGTLVVRPDSGHPVDTPVRVVEEMLERFGFTINDKGYKVLPDHVRVIQGDGIEYETIEQILDTLDSLKISSDNITFGMGGALLQKVNRDTFKFAIKMSGIIVDGEERDVFKNPVTDPGKVSKKGFLTLVKNDDGSFESVRIKDVNSRQDMLSTVYKDGIIHKLKFDEIRGL